ncbi:hypothetical protein MMC28_008864 [Mycoblastus sanguinarius]|nr:hypothetical protein [Mycoblastus sanguinarius]
MSLRQECPQEHLKDSNLDDRASDRALASAEDSTKKGHDTASSRRETLKEDVNAVNQPAPGHVYTRISATPNARQVNGDVRSEPTSKPGPGHHYDRIVATDNSQQINGNVDLEAFTAFFSQQK